MPEAVAQVAREERLLELVTLTTESGAIGGVPANGLDFGAAINLDAVVEQNQQFDFYDGGGLDVAFLGMAECDAVGNVNVSRFGNRLAGAGGFINISQSARTVVFVGTFTADGLEIATGAGQLDIVREGQTRKFVARVGQVSFSGAQSRKLKQTVLYVTERCVFRRGADGIELIEIAPGVDLERDILRHMDFQPRVHEPKMMDPRIFTTATMELRAQMFPIDLESRISYDAERNLLFNNLEGLAVKSARDIELIRRAVERRCRAVGKAVRVIVNYDSFALDDALADAWAGMVRQLCETYYSRVSRYTTSAFLRLKLGDAFLRHDVAPHLFATEAEARRFHEA
jgi:propionate CoA-transferase